MADDAERLLGDELYVRLWLIRREVEAGTADHETVERWEELCATVTTVVESLQAAILSAEPPDRDEAIRRWIRAFVDVHWPVPTLH